VDKLVRRRIITLAIYVSCVGKRWVSESFVC